MSKNIVVLSGSPRKDGSTDKLVTAFAEGAKSVGKESTIFRVSDMNIAGCTGCAYCFKEKGICAIKDDMSKILTAIKMADAIVLASPVYFASVSGQLKLALDRTTALTLVEMPTKQAALLMTCMSKESSEPAVAMYKTTLPFKKWNDAGIVIASGLNGTNSIDEYIELDEARKLGIII